jgi:hypothetical protein
MMSSKFFFVVSFFDMKNSLLLPEEDVRIRLDWIRMFNNMRSNNWLYFICRRVFYLLQLRLLVAAQKIHPSKKNGVGWVLIMN